MTQGASSTQKMRKNDKEKIDHVRTSICTNLLWSNMLTSKEDLKLLRRFCPKKRIRLFCPSTLGSKTYLKKYFLNVKFSNSNKGIFEIMKILIAIYAKFILVVNPFQMKSILSSLLPNYPLNLNTRHYKVLEIKKN